jgi:hypothetical protein
MDVAAGIQRAWMAEWATIMKAEPAWLTGWFMGRRFGCVAEIRKLVPENIRFMPRHHPQHSLPVSVPDWIRLCATEAREPINPRPTEIPAFITSPPHSIGFLTYSEGCNDDVNKAVWSTRVG